MNGDALLPEPHIMNAVARSPKLVFHFAFAGLRSLKSLQPDSLVVRRDTASSSYRTAHGIYTAPQKLCWYKYYFY